MAITARTWVTGELGTAAKHNTVRDDLLDIETRMDLVRSIQRGTVSLGGNLTVDATLSPSIASTAKTRIRLLGHTITSGSPAARDAHARIALLSTTALRVTRQASANIGLTVSYEVTEYD